MSVKMTLRAHLESVQEDLTKNGMAAWASRSEFIAAMDLLRESEAREKELLEALRACMTLAALGEYPARVTCDRYRELINKVAATATDSTGAR